MQHSYQTGAIDGELVKPPFLYEIRVKGRLSSEQWTSWFDDLHISTSGAESTLRGSVPDHAALYGLLSRLRDLAIPLVTVRVLDAEAQRKLYQQSRRYDLTINLLLVGIYLALLGGLVTITIFVAPIIYTVLALALLAATLGGLAHAFWLWSGQQVWRWITYVTWPACGIAFLIFIPVSGLLPPALGIGVMLFLGAGALLYLLFYVRRRAENINLSLANGVTRAGAEAEVAADRVDETAEAGRAIEG